MVQLLNGSEVSIGNDPDNGCLSGVDLVQPPPGRLFTKWRNFLAGAPLPRGLAWAIIQLVSLFFWVAVAGAIYRFWR